MLSPTPGQMAGSYPDILFPPRRKPRIFASGTLFQTHTFVVPRFLNSELEMIGTTVTRAHSVTKTLNGNAMGILKLLTGMNAFLGSGGNETYLMAPMGGSYEGKTIVEELEREGIRTKYCKIVEGSGVPGAWVFRAKGLPGKNVILHNPLPDLTHEEFVSLLGPILIPENYPPASPSSAPQPPPPPNTAPFEWLHFECRSFKTTLSNLQGLDGLARDRGWRHKVTFSFDVSGTATADKQRGVHAIVPHVDVVFFDKLYAQSLGYTAPRPFLLAMTPHVAPHALLIINWAESPVYASPSNPFPDLDDSSESEGGAAVLSLPTREYFQSSSFTPPPPPNSHLTPKLNSAYNDVLDISHQNMTRNAQSSKAHLRNSKVESVTSGSAFYADGHRSSVAASSSFGFGFGDGFQSIDISHSTTRREMQSRSQSRPQSQGHMHTFGADDWDMYTVSHTPSIIDTRENDHFGPGGGRGGHDEEEDDEDGDDGLQSAENRQAEHSAFVGGMIHALTRKLLPGGVWSPVIAPNGSGTAGGGAGVGTRTVSMGSGTGSVRSPQSPVSPGIEERRWGLDECLKFSTELSGRRRYLSRHTRGHKSKRSKGHAPDRRTLDKDVIEEMKDAGWF